MLNARVLPMAERHSPLAHAAYHDLLCMLLDDRVSDLRGTATKVLRAGKTYFGMTATALAQRCEIGGDSPELQARLARHATFKAEAQDRALRAEGLMGLDATGSRRQKTGDKHSF